MSKKSSQKIKSNQEILNGIRGDWGEVKPVTVVFEDRRIKRARKYPQKIVEEGLRAYYNNEDFKDFED